MRRAQHHQPNTGGHASVAPTCIASTGLTQRGPASISKARYAFHGNQLDTTVDSSTYPRGISPEPGYNQFKEAICNSVATSSTVQRTCKAHPVLLPHNTPDGANYCGANLGPVCAGQAPTAVTNCTGRCHNIHHIVPTVENHRQLKFPSPP